MTEPTAGNGEEIEKYLSDHLEVLTSVEVYLKSIKLWNYLIPVLLLIVGVILGYLLSYFICHRNRNPESDDEDGPALSAEF